MILNLLLIASSLVSQSAIQSNPTKTEKLVLWNGESKSIGVGWVNIQSPNLSINVEEGKAFSGKKFIRFVCNQQKTYGECGWQWAPWAPEFEGTDLSPFTKVSVAVRITGTKLPNDFVVSLRSPGDHHLTKLVSLKKAEPKIYDGKWHKVTFKLAEMYYPEMKFDTRHCIQLLFAGWNPEGSFILDFDDLVLE